MQYESGESVNLGDFVEFDVGPDKYVNARVVMIGDTYEHESLEGSFLAWVENDKVLDAESVIVELCDAGGAPRKGSYMFTTLGSVRLLAGRNDADAI